jgi:hypothetical protein
MSSKTKSKKPTQEDEDPDVEDSAPVPKPSKKKDAVAAAPPKKKAKVAAAAADPEPEEDPDEEAGEEEAGEEEVEVSPEEKAKLQKALTKKRKKAKLVGYRSLSKTAGYVDTGPDGVHSTTNDCLGSLLSEADAKRLMRFVPATPGSAGFAGDEFMRRLDLFKNSVPGSAARETQARCDAILRSAMDQAVLRSVEAGKKTVSASTMASVLRQYAPNMEFTAVVPPLGLVRYAQDAGVLNPLTEDELKKRGDEKKENTANKKAYTDFVDSKEKEKVAKREKKAAAQAAAHAAVTAA